MLSRCGRQTVLVPPMVALEAQRPAVAVAEEAVPVPPHPGSTTSLPTTRRQRPRRQAGGRRPRQAGRRPAESRERLSKRHLLQSFLRQTFSRLTRLLRPRRGIIIRRQGAAAAAEHRSKCSGWMPRLRRRGLDRTTYSCSLKVKNVVVLLFDLYHSRY